MRSARSLSAVFAFLRLWQAKIVSVALSAGKKSFRPLLVFFCNSRRVFLLERSERLTVGLVADG